MCKCAHMHAYMHARTHTHTRMHARTHARTKPITMPFQASTWQGSDPLHQKTYSTLEAHTIQDDTYTMPSMESLSLTECRHLLHWATAECTYRLKYTEKKQQLIFHASSLQCRIASQHLGKRTKCHALHPVSRNFHRYCL